MAQLPALALAAAPGRRAQTLNLVREIESRGFAGIYCASFGDAIGLCLSIAHTTNSISFGTSIANIYARNPFDMAQAGAYIHELSEERFYLGIGVSHGPANQRLGASPGRPLSDMRGYVEAMRSSGEQFGPLPPIVLATLREKMTALAGEIAEGAVWANASLSHVRDSLATLPDGKVNSGQFFIGDMLPTCIDDDANAAAARNRRTLISYVSLPNYRNYWKEAGYVEEMEAIEQALSEGRQDQLPELMTDQWLADCTLFGTVSQVRTKLEEWFAVGISTPIVVPSSTSGGQMKAFEEVITAFA